MLLCSQPDTVRRFPLRETRLQHLLCSTPTIYGFYSVSFCTGFVKENMGFCHKLPGSSCICPINYLYCNYTDDRQDFQIPARHMLYSHKLEISPEALRNPVHMVFARAESGYFNVVSYGIGRHLSGGMEKPIVRKYNHFWHIYCNLENNREGIARGKTQQHGHSPCYAGKRMVE